MQNSRKVHQLMSIVYATYKKQQQHDKDRSVDWGAIDITQTEQPNAFPGPSRNNVFIYGDVNILTVQHDDNNLPSN